MTLHIFMFETKCEQTRKTDIRNTKFLSPGEVWKAIIRPTGVKEVNLNSSGFLAEETLISASSIAGKELPKAQTRTSKSSATQSAWFVLKLDGVSPDFPWPVHCCIGDSQSKLFLVTLSWCLLLVAEVCRAMGKWPSVVLRSGWG